MAAGLAASALLAAGCGQAHAGGGAPADHLVYHVSVTLQDPTGVLGASERGLEWLDPAGGRFNVRSVESQAGGHAAPLRVADVGRPGVDEGTTWFPAGSGLPFGRQTILTYGTPPAETAPPETMALSVLRAYLGFPSPGASRYRVTHAGGHVVLTFGLPDRSFAALRALGAPASVLAKFRRAARRTRIVLTILGTTSPQAAQRRGLFAIDPARADEVVRMLAAGVAPRAPTPSYWLGPAWDGAPAGQATATVARRGPAEDSYDIAYGHGPAGSVLGLHVTTTPLPPGAAGHMRLLGGHGRFGRGRRIRLADGTPAEFYYRSFPPSAAAPPKGASAVESSSFSQWTMGGVTATSTAPLADPPLVIVATRRVQIIIAPPGAMSRARALRTARALRRV